MTKPKSAGIVSGNNGENSRHWRHSDRQPWSFQMLNQYDGRCYRNSPGGVLTPVPQGTTMFRVENYEEMTNEVNGVDPDPI